MKPTFKYRLAAELRGIPIKGIEALVQQNIQSREQFEDVIRSLPNAGPALARQLGMTESELLAVLGWPCWPDFCCAATADFHRVGGALEPKEIERPVSNAAPVISVPALPDHISLCAYFGPARNQGPFGACVGFSTASMIEGLVGRSEQYRAAAFLYSRMKARDGEPSDGGYLRDSTAVALEEGVCLEQTWPYRPDRAYLRSRPSKEAFNEARSCRLASRIALPARDVDAIRIQLAERRPVAISVPIHESTRNSVLFHAHGRFNMPLGILDHVAGGHALCITDYFDNSWLLQHGFPEEVGGGCFLARNSWGHDWAAGNSIALSLGVPGGYAIIPYGFLARYGWEAFTGTLCEQATRSVLANPARMAWPIVRGWWDRSWKTAVAFSREETEF